LPDPAGKQKPIGADKPRKQSNNEEKSSLPDPARKQKPIGAEKPRKQSNGDGCTDSSLPDPARKQKLIDAEKPRKQSNGDSCTENSLPDPPRKQQSKGPTLKQSRLDEPGGTKRKRDDQDESEDPFWSNSTKPKNFSPTLLSLETVEVGSHGLRKRTKFS
jgi:hypothetical protein